MKHDKAIRKIVSKNEMHGLPYGFEMRVMREVVRAADKKQRRSLTLNYVSVSVVSLLLASVGFYLIKFYWNYNIQLDWPSVLISESNKWLFFCSIFLGALALLLLMLDLLIRRIMHKD